MGIFALVASAPSALPAGGAPETSGGARSRAAIFFLNPERTDP